MSHKPISILVVDDEESVRSMLKETLSQEGYSVDDAQDASAAIDQIEKKEFAIILCDIKMPGINGMEFLKAVKRKDVSPPVIMMSAYGTVDDAIECVKQGAYDYINKPFRTDELILTIKKTEERERLLRENLFLRRAVEKEYNYENLIGKSPQMLRIYETIAKIASYKTTILITGESGTGKELVAKALHFNSPRRDEPFVTINCAAIPENLLESELFGYVKGAFTGAGMNKKGLFEEADRGSLFLDEIGELPGTLQVKLLRVLQEGEIRRVGDTKSTNVDVRIIAATARELDKEVKAGRFREDLFYRLNVINIFIPPLRERKEDIPFLVEHFIRKFNEKLNKSIKSLDPAAMNYILDNQWKGNIRELENVIERAMVLCDGNGITTDHLPSYILQKKEIALISAEDSNLSIPTATALVERELIQRALKLTGGNKKQAAQLLEISNRALCYKIKQYGIAGIERV
ncbi:MAG TPA: sigma-54 dependent transcriptional regulator [bacterium]